MNVCEKCNITNILKRSSHKEKHKIEESAGAVSLWNKVYLVALKLENPFSWLQRSYRT